MRRKINAILVLLFAGCILFYAYVQHRREKAFDNALYAAQEAVEGNKKRMQEEELENPADEMASPEAPKKIELVGDKYEEGEIIGTLSYLENETPVGVGTSSEDLEGKAIIHPRSEMAHKIMLGHCYKNGSVFGSLWQLKEEDSVTLNSVDGVEEFKVTKIEWMEEDEYNTSETIQELFEGENRPALMLITCMSKEGTDGRLLVSCENI